MNCPRILENAWYCAAWSHEIPKHGVLGRKLLGRHVVLFRDGTGQVHALSAVCPHRGADLARGRVVDNTLECPLHGWCFNLKGECAVVPSQPSSLKISPAARVSCYMIAEKEDVIWIWVGQKPEIMPDVPQLHTREESAKRRRHFNPPKLWKGSFVNVVENAIDTTHVPFIHVKSLGSNQRRLYPRQRIIIDTDCRGFSGEDSPKSSWGNVRNAQLVGGIGGSVASRALGMRRIQREHYRFDLGGTLSYHVEWDTGTWDTLVAHCTPADEFQTWFFGASIRTRATHFLGDLAQLWFLKKLIDEDELAVTQMLSNDSKLLPSPISVVGDEPTLAFRRIYDYHLNLQDQHQ